MNYGALFRSALVALLRNKMRSILTVLGITIGIAAVICVVAIDPETHRVYTPEQEEDGKPVARMIVYDAVINP